MATFWLGPKASARGYRLFGYERIGSTSTEAANAARNGDAGEVWFAALEQSAGRGRRGRPWQTVPGNLAASLLVLPQCDPTIAATLGFAAGVALHRALTGLLPGASRIALKWPNDVLADGAKLAGILLEALNTPDGRLAITIGFGVNVVAAPSDLPYPATSLADLGMSAMAPAIFSELAECWVEIVEIWDNGRNVPEILKLWRAAAAGIGAEVVIRQENGVVRGIFETIDDTGRLIVRGNDNSRIAITAGDVHFGATASIRNL